MRRAHWSARVELVELAELVAMSGNRRSGRRRMPTVLKRMIGSKVRHDARAEPAGAVGVPPVPPHLAIDPDARAAWDALADRLVGQRVLTDAHGELLAILADAWAQYVRLRRAFATDGFRSTIVQEWIDHKGEVRKRTVDNPLTRQIRQQALLLNTLFGEFGQTPASAPKVIAHPGTTDPFEDFLSKGHAQVVPFPSTRPRSKRSR